MPIKDKIKKFFDKYVFNVKWKCSVCGKEIFNDNYFCSECENSLPFVGDTFCEHCGRKTVLTVGYCSTCKQTPTNFEVGRSVFNYEKPIDLLIQRFKYGDCRYLSEVFAEFLQNEYFKQGFNADFLVYIPMSKRAKRKRGYNQAKLLAEELSKRISIPVFEDIEKVKETKRQATLGRAERIKNLEGAYKVKNKKLLLDKRVLIVDDVTTTGSTIEVMAKVLKNAGALWVGFLTIASVPPKEKN